MKRFTIHMCGVAVAGATIAVAVGASVAQSRAPEGLGAQVEAGAVVAGGDNADGTVGALSSVKRWGRVGDITAYSVATTSCNVGNVPLSWVSNTSMHPVIAQNIFRLKDGRFEQIGMSWVKHAVCAVQMDGLCGPCEPTGPSCEDTLGVGCADPYSANFNGTQNILGPRYLVNPVTGDIEYPWDAPEPEDTIGRRVQVRDADIDPDVNEGAQYFVEGHYVWYEDAQAGNQTNNAAYRAATVLLTGPDEFTIVTAESTVQGTPAIMAWQATEPDVQVETVDVAGDGGFILAYKVTDNGDGTWHYEYALHNSYSQRAARAFTIEVPPGVNVTNVGFRDVDPHSGSPYSSADWASSADDCELVWSTDEYAVDQFANALRWGMLNNFRFDADAPPSPSVATIGLFLPGSPESVDVDVLAPGAGGGGGVVTIVDSYPPHGAIDARQPSDPDGGNPAGWDAFDLVFSADVGCISANDFLVTHTGDDDPPTVAAIAVDGPNVIVSLSERIALVEWTTLTHVPSGSEVRIAALPSDVNGDTQASANDVLVLIDALNGAIDPLAEYQTDIDRSGLTNPSDVLRVIDLLNGAGVYEEFLGLSLPD